MSTDICSCRYVRGLVRGAYKYPLATGGLPLVTLAEGRNVAWGAPLPPQWNGCCDYEGTAQP